MTAFTTPARTSRARAKHTGRLSTRYKVARAVRYVTLVRPTFAAFELNVRHARRWFATDLLRCRRRVFGYIGNRSVQEVFFMALWNEKTATQTTREPTPTQAPSPTLALREAPTREPAVAEKAAALAASEPAARLAPAAKAEMRESVIAAGITIEGKVQGMGHLRISGAFKGDVAVEGNLIIEVGAKVTGQIRATTVTVAGELEGNIDGAKKVELLETGLIAGDVKAGTLTVAAGSRMRGQVEFGGEDRGKSGPAGK
jgi:cytoskeletal protein CcmA (bactofilin family)